MQNIEEKALQFLILIGIYFIFIQYIQDRGMWLDEVSLNLNIKNKSFLQLLEPLDGGQVAPILYLWIQKTMITILGDNDIHFRHFPFTATLISGFLIYQITKYLDLQKTTGLLCVGLFFIHPHIINFSSEAKQYPIDVFSTILLIYLILKYEVTAATSSKILLIIISCLLIPLSNTIIITMSVVGLYLLLKDIIGLQKVSFSTILIGISWLGTFSLYYLFFIANHPSEEVMLNYWEGRGLPSEKVIYFNDYISWFFKVLDKQLFNQLLLFENRASRIVINILIVLGISSLLLLIKEKKYKILLIALGPFVVHCLLALFSFYPFHKKFLLYLLPLIILFYTSAYEVLLSYFHQKKIASTILKCALLIVILPLCSFDYNKYPSVRDGFKDSIIYLNQHIGLNDDVYIIAGGNRNIYYEDLIKFKNTIESIGLGRVSQKGIRKIEKLRLRKNETIWIIFSRNTSNWKRKLIPILERKGNLSIIKPRKGILKLQDSKEYLYKLEAK